MRVAVVGPHRDGVISKVEEAFDTTVKKPWDIDDGASIIDYAAETYKYFNEYNVVFDGSPFDFLVKEDDEGYDDVYEQIALNTLDNLNYIAVITLDMDKSTLKMYKEYAKIYPNKFYFFTSYNDFELTLR